MKQPPDPFVTRFQELYFDEFGEKISEGEALDKLTRLTNVLRVLLSSPLPDSLDTPVLPRTPFDGGPESDILKTS